MTKRKIIFIIGMLCFAVCISITFAAFVYDRMINGTATTGNIYQINTKILNYSPYALKTSQEARTEFEEATNKSAFLNNLESREDTAVEISSENSIICYATRRTGTADEIDEYNLPYLNQLGFKFSFVTSIDVYVRIHFEDAWLSKKVFTGNRVEESYIVKDQLNGIYQKLSSNEVSESNFAAYYVINPKDQTNNSYSNSALYYTYVAATDTENEKYVYANITNEEFKANAELSDNDESKVKYYTLQTSKLQNYDSSKSYYKFSSESPFKFKDENNEWYFDVANNIAYKKEKINVDEKLGRTESDSFSFDIEPTYFYKEKPGSYREVVKIKLAYYVDIVQANRAYEIWGIDPSELV